MKTTTGLIIFVLVAVLLLRASAFVVTEAEQVIITQFGDPKRVVQEPGLYFKMPFIQELYSLEKRVLPWDGAPAVSYTHLTLPTN